MSRRATCAERVEVSRDAYRVGVKPILDGDRTNIK